MSFTDKLFSLLGFAEAIPLSRFHGDNLLPEKVLLLSTSSETSNVIEKTLIQLNLKVVLQDDVQTEQSFSALVIDGTDFNGEQSYQRLYQTVHKHLCCLTKNARIVIIGNVISLKQSTEHNTFSQALVGFSKSLAKEVGRKGSTANILFIPADSSNLEKTALLSPLRFLLSTKSTFVSGQIITVDTENANAIPNDHHKEKKVAVVTGAAQGIGAAIAEKLSCDGYFVIGVDIEPMKDVLYQGMAKLQGKAFIVDVSNEQAGKKLADLAAQHNGFDIIVHNAGITRDKTLAKMPEHWWQQTIAINLLSVIRINNELLADNAINNGGRIVCLSSMNGIAGQGGQTNYACSKAGIIGYVSSSATEFAKQSITINAVAPGFIETKMTQQMPFFTREMGRRMNALGQGGLPIDVAETVAFLAESECFAISGQTIRVCGLNMMGA